jgi:hypothetical protein
MAPGAIVARAALGVNRALWSHGTAASGLDAASEGPPPVSPPVASLPVASLPVLAS